MIISAQRAMCRLADALTERCAASDFDFNGSISVEHAVPLGLVGWEQSACDKRAELHRDFDLHRLSAYL